jgi:hypothetical protein
MNDVCFSPETSESQKRACASCQRSHRLYELDKTIEKYNGNKRIEWFLKYGSIFLSLFTAMLILYNFEL